MNISNKTVGTVIQLAQEWRDAQPKMPKGPIMNFAELALQHMKTPPEERTRLYKFIDGLPDDEKHELAAIAWCGRGDYDDFQAAVNNSKRHSPTTTATYLVGKKDLDKYLSDGLDRIADGFPKSSDDTSDEPEEPKGE